MRLSKSDLKRIRTGVVVTLEGQGFPVEGDMEQDHWTFNFGAVGAVHVTTTEGLKVFYGNFADAEVAVHHP